MLQQKPEWIRRTLTAFILFAVLPQSLAEDIPNLILESERLVLKPLSQSDTKIVAAILMNPKNMQMSGDFVSQKDVSLTLFKGAHSISEFNKMSVFPKINFGIYLDEKLIGFAQIFKGTEEAVYFSGIGHQSENWVSIGYELDPSYWKNGFATEASERLISFAFETMKVDGIHADTTYTNIGSQKVLHKSGFTRINHHLHDRFHYVFLKENFNSVQIKKCIDETLPRTRDI